MISSCLRALALLLLIAVAAPTAVHAEAETWVGNTSALFDAANWSGTNNPPLTADSLIFGAAGTAGTTLTDDRFTPGTFSIAGITFNAGAAAFTLNPNTPGTNGFLLTGNVTNYSTSLETINDRITLTAARSFTTSAGGGDITLGGVLGGPGGVTAGGTGTLTLTQANTYSGRTTVNGRLLLAFSADVTSNILSSSSALTLSDGTLQLTGAGMQTVSGLTTSANTGSRIVLSSDQTLTLGPLTSAGGGSALNFNTAAGGANGASVGTGIVVLTGRTAGNAINSGFTVTDAGGFGLATVNASNQVVRLTTTALLPASGAGSTIDYRLDNNADGAAAAGSSSLAITSSQAVKSLTVDTSTASGVVTLNSGVVLSNNIWNFGGIGANTWQISGSAGGAGLKSLSLSNTIQINNDNSGAVTISAPILDNGTNSVNLKGTGTTIFAGVNIYTGQTTIRGGTLEVATGGSITTPSNFMTVGHISGDNATLNLTGGSVSNASGTLGNNAGSSGTATVSSGTWTNSDSLDVGYQGTGVLNVTGGTVSSSFGVIGSNAGSSGTATVSSGSWSNSGSLYVAISGTVVLNVTGSGVVNVGGVAGSGTLTLGNDSTGNGTLNLGSGGVAGTLNAATVTTGSGTGVVNFNQTGSYSFAPQLTGALSVNKLGAGTTTLTSATNTYTGTTTVSAGTLVANNASGSATGSGGLVVVEGAVLAGSGRVNAGSNAITLNGDVSIGVSGDLDLSLELGTTGGSGITLGSTGAMRFDLFEGAGAGDNTASLTATDLLILYGDISLLSGASLLIDNPNNLSAWAIGDQWRLWDVSNAGTRSGNFALANILAPALSGDKVWDFNSSTGILSIVVPEPGRAVLMLLGLGTLLLRRRRS